MSSPSAAPAGTAGMESKMDNVSIARLLSETADLMEIAEEEKR